MQDILNWTALGKALRASADDAHDGNTPDVQIAYQFFLDNPGAFIGDHELYVINSLIHMGGTLTMEDVNIGNVEWPEELVPAEPNGELIAAYYGAI